MSVPLNFNLPIRDLLDLIRDLRLIDEGKLRNVWNEEAGRYEWRRWKRPKAEEPRCRARCRDGHACRARVVPGRRCRIHGGLSTGPKTAEGRERIRESNRRRAAGV